MPETPQSARSRTTLSCGRWSYVLDESASIVEFRDVVERAVRSGGGFVDVPVAGDATVSIFVGPAAQLRLVTQAPDAGIPVTVTASDGSGEWDFAEFA